MRGIAGVFMADELLGFPAHLFDRNGIIAKVVLQADQQ
jgi:hypothetical protein